MSGVTIRPVYDTTRRSLRSQLFGVHVDGVLVLICTSFPSWLVYARKAR